MKDTAVLCTWIAMGHLIPMVEFAKLLSKHGMSVAVVIVDLTQNASSFRTKTLARLSEANPTISFHVLPPAVSRVFQAVDLNAILQIIQQANAPLSDLLHSMQQTCSVRALVLDFYCASALPVARQLHIAPYFFYTSGAYNLALDVYFPTIDKTVDRSIREMGTELLHFPALPPIPATHLPDRLHRRDSPLYKTFIDYFDMLLQSDGILVNTFESMEKKAVQALKTGLCSPGRDAPRIYCVGPVVNGDEKKEEERHECLAWLDAQPKNSVVFLSFGSIGAFSEEQLREIATGLEESGQRFLWVVRNPSITSPTKMLDPEAAPDLHSILPDGFIERTKERGMLLKQWAPQVEVLSHESVGAFVTHCGWNSILEATMASVPMICWPMYNEQKLNKIFLVEEMKVALAMEGFDENVVLAKEVACKVRSLMESEEGKEIRERMEGMRGKAVEAVRKGGASHRSLMEFLNAVRN